MVFIEFSENSSKNAVKINLQVSFQSLPLFRNANLPQSDSLALWCPTFDTKGLTLLAGARPLDWRTMRLSLAAARAVQIRQEVWLAATSRLHS